MANNRPRKGTSARPPKSAPATPDAYLIALGALVGLVLFRYLVSFFDRIGRRVRRGKRAVVPNEIILLVQKDLAKAGDKSSLVNLMLASRRSYLLGLPVLYRDLDLLQVADAWKLDALVDPSLPRARDKWRHVRTLRVWFDSHEEPDSIRALAVLEILDACRENLEELGIWCYGGIAQEIWDRLPLFHKVKNLEICFSRGEMPWIQRSMGYSADPGVLLDPVFASDFPLARPGRPASVESALPPALKHLVLGSSRGSGASWDADDLLGEMIDPISRHDSLQSWSLYAPFVDSERLHLHPVVCSKLSRYSGCLLNGLRDMFRNPDFSPHSLLVVAFDFVPDVWQEICRMEALESLQVIGLPCSPETLAACMAEGTFPRLRALILEFPRLRPDSEGSLDATQRAFMRLAQRARWDILVVPAEQEDEDEFWDAIDGIQIVDRADPRVKKAGLGGSWPSADFP